ncbi:MAG: carbohydrate ABC transporter permease [Actinomycetota bacterium]|nr:carbohydrate ABC transporter permease [Actinomycetota bacterium]
MRGRTGFGPAWGTIRIVVGVLVVVWSLAPIYWGFVIAFASAADIRRSPASVLPQSFELGNFARLLGPDSATASAFFSALGSSIVQAVGTTVLTLLIALPAAYAFARLRFAGSRVLLVVITVTLAVPVYLVLIPLFQLATATGQINTQQGVILVLTSAALPLAIWILRSHIVTLPEDIEAAARLDGAGTFRVLGSVIGPLVAPGLVAAAVVTFLASWGAFLIPLVYANTTQTEPLTVLIPTFASKFSSDYGLQSAAGLIAVLPPVLLVVLLQKYLLSGLLRGATK